MDNKNKAIFLQLADNIMDRIVGGTYPPETRLPSVRDYAAEMQVNANTVVRTYDVLERQGIIYNKRGVGYFVMPDAVATVKTHLKEEFLGDHLPRMFAAMNSIGIEPDQLRDLYKNYLSTKQISLK